jgi:protoheme IX farnesyltransferase
MIGWTAMTGEVNLIAVLLFAIIFMWTPPHFWALALYRASDYAKVGVPMLPVVAGARATKLQILLYSLGLIPLTLAPYVIGFSGMFYGLVALLLGAGFMLCAVRVWFDRTDRSARRMFAFSILYLFLLFSVLVADSMVPGAVGIAQAMGI